jgi:F-type H+-transporting ATPase subunit epsilon
MSAPSEHMRLEVFTPTALLVDDAAVKVIAEGPEGYGEERLLGIDEGVLVKRGAEVRVSVLDAFESDDLASLRKQVARRFLSLDEHERSARTALARLEAGAIRHVLEIER